MTRMNAYEFSARAIDGEQKALADFSGQVSLIVNTASQCGFTPQYAGLQDLYESYRHRGFAVLGFPCDQFGHQEPGADDEIAVFCESNYQVTFPMFAKVDVNGADAHPLYDWLTSQKPGLLGRAIKWNFTKFLVDREGRVVKRYAPQTKPADIASDIDALLDG